jgi:hypothetical protein
MTNNIYEPDEVLFIFCWRGPLLLCGLSARDSTYIHDCIRGWQLPEHQTPQKPGNQKVGQVWGTRQMRKWIKVEAVFDNGDKMSGDLKAERELTTLSLNKARFSRASRENHHARMIDFYDGGGEPR